MGAKIGPGKVLTPGTLRMRAKSDMKKKGIGVDDSGGWKKSLGKTNGEVLCCIELVDRDFGVTKNILDKNIELYYGSK